MDESKRTSGTSQLPNDLIFATTPNLITLLRIFFVPAIVALLLIPSDRNDLIAAILFAIASITDYLDGYLARLHNQESIYGKLMDPLADKFLVVSALIALQEVGRIHPVIVILLVCREMAITGLRALASAEGIIMGASAGAKWKTATQMVAIPFIMARSQLFGIPLYWPGMVLLYLSLFISLWSAREYFAFFFHALLEKRKKKGLP